MTTEAIWNEFGSGLFGFIKGKVNNQENAEDIFQDVFIKIHQKSGQLKEEDKLSSWVYQITRNAIIDSTERRSCLFQTNWLKRKIQKMRRT